MRSVIERLVPPSAGNDYRGSRVALWVFCGVALLMLGRSLIHFLKADAGLQSIATIITFAGDPDPDRVIHLFGSLWGSQQVITCAIYAVVLWRYRNLVPLMWLLLIVEAALRAVSGTLHPLTEEFYLRTPPGKTGALPMLVLYAVMLVLSLRERRPRAVD